ncbi:uncharacterized protein E0L32_004214 [Thyridium curvatum]|uniref:Uncharacterized protein n=1 Tax=Thyridium curvatum TaxID=1093900 RepID=A0A507BFZ0_9PEZI|nr:uncharacterized protein E0L32_004214 [Thyridium curvatum]TPX16219.1 hypothetical protein E0L32_004214 [Thyridium curvatum]
MSLHYQIARQPDNVMNFRIAGAWEPVTDVTGGDGNGPSRSSHRRMPLLFEGILMTYLGLYLEGEHSDRHPECTYSLNKLLRGARSMPNFSASSLNKAWPLYQGAPGLGLTNSSTPYARCCSNPNCDATTHTSKSWGWLPNETEKTEDNVLCTTCLVYWRRKGKMRNANDHAYKLKTGRAAKVYICSNLLCGSDKVDKNWGFWDGFEGRKDINSILCRQCRVHANNYNGAMRDPAKTAHKGKAIPKDRECSYPNCNATAADTEHWGRWNGLTEEKDESNILCARCLAHANNHGGICGGPSSPTASRSTSGPAQTPCVEILAQQETNNRDGTQTNQGRRQRTMSSNELLRPADAAIPQVQDLEGFNRRYLNHPALNVVVVRVGRGRFRIPVSIVEMSVQDREALDENTIAFIKHLALLMIPDGIPEEWRDWLVTEVNFNAYNRKPSNMSHCRQIREQANADIPMSANAINILAAQCCLLGNVPIAPPGTHPGRRRRLHPRRKPSFRRGEARLPGWDGRQGQAVVIVDPVDDEEAEPAPGAVLGPVAQPRRHPLKLVNFGGVGAKILKTIVWILAALTVCYLAFLLLAIGIRLANHPGLRPARVITAFTAQCHGAIRGYRKKLVVSK